METAGVAQGTCTVWTSPPFWGFRPVATVTTTRGRRSPSPLLRVRPSEATTTLRILSVRVVGFLGFVAVCRFVPRVLCLLGHVGLLRR